MGRNFVMGDIHGACRALRQCLERSGFDRQNDNLIFLGDVTDGWPETKECVDELLKIRNLTYLLGNHDLWALEWMQTGLTDPLWLEQGGRATVESYRDGVPSSHQKLLEESLPFFITENRLFVHAGFDPKAPIADQTMDTFLWDRTLARTALYMDGRAADMKLSAYDEIYLGHTPVEGMKPVKACEVWLMDTGAGWSGALSMMDINSKEIFTSDPVPLLYPGVAGRKKFIKVDW
jgi:serine/threonine protein phosphatase 1